MKKLFFAAILCVLALASCNRQKSFTITGGFDIPEEIDLGDTIIERGPLDGTYVYLLDLNGEMVDSALVENETFTFTGKITAKDAYFAYVASDFSYGMVAIEPGEIGMTIGQEVLAFGSPTNDAINDLDAKVAEIAQEFNDRMMKLIEEAGGNPSDSLIMPFYQDFNGRCLSLLDSTYQSNKKNLIGVYAANIKTSSAQSLEELEEMLKEYDEYISESPVMEARRGYFYSLSARDMFNQLQLKEEEGEE